MGGRIAAVLLSLGLSACGGNAILFGERAEAVVQTPDYGDNRVFYFEQAVKQEDKEVETAISVALKPSYLAPGGEDYKPKHGRPLSIILSSASLPKAISGTPKSRDVALLVQFGSDAGGGDRTLAVWYQRGVPPDQPLNFGNLVIFHEPMWESRVAPFFRIRLIDVAEERNQEARAELAKVTAFSRAVGLFTANPLVDPAINAMSNAATLVLANGRNKVLLDYSVQFFSDEAADSAPAAGLTRLRKGSFLLLGRPLGMDRTYWRRNFEFDRQLQDIVEKDTTGKPAVISPFVQITVSDQEIVVPALVQRRSTAIQTLLSNAGRENTEALTDAADSLAATVRVFVLNENLRRFRSSQALLAVYEAVDNEEVDKMSLSKEDLYVLYRVLTTVSGCSLFSKESVVAWWNAKGSSGQFRSDEFKLNSYESCT
jgi:hypothetical protein